jgi:hypothetical protein
MKTTILISSFAALCLMISIAESPSRSGAEKSIIVPGNRISLVPASNPHTFQGNKLSPGTANSTVGLTHVSEAKDFSYLKFKIANFIEKDDDASAESGVITTLPEPDCSYLKFDVNNYKDNTAVGSLEGYELPESDFANLRFDVEYYEEKNSESFETMDLPGDNFRYLKFDVRDYFVESDMGAGVFGELPVAETQPFCCL